MVHEFPSFRSTENGWQENSSRASSGTDWTMGNLRKVDPAAIPGHATVLYGGEASCRNAVETTFPLQYDGFPPGRALSSAG